jgi:hypothetical protein
MLTARLGWFPKAWLFAAPIVPANAVMLTLIWTAKLNDVDPPGPGLSMCRLQIFPKASKSLSSGLATV